MFYFVSQELTPSHFKTLNSVLCALGHMPSVSGCNQGVCRLMLSITSEAKLLKIERIQRSVFINH